VSTDATPERASTDTRPFAAFEWALATRYLRARRREGFISVIAGFSFLGIMLGVATLIIVMAVMNGFRQELFEKILGLNGHMVAYRVGAEMEDHPDLRRKLESVAGVVKAFPLVEGQAMVSGPAQTLGGLVRGLAEADIKAQSFISANVKEGTLDGFDTRTAVAIGQRMASALRVKVGDSITLIAPRGSTTPFGTAPRIKRYAIAAIFELGMSEYDKTMVFMPLAEAQRFFNKGASVDVLELMVENPDHVGTVAEAVRKAGGTTLHTIDWRQRNESFFTVLQVERNMMFIILSLIVIVAAFNIISGLMMLVKDKSRDIAILRTMGATKHAMMRVFLITGASIGVVGALAGLVLGVVFCWNIEGIRQFVAWATSTQLFNPEVYYLTRLPARIDYWETGSIVGLAMLLSVLATLYPSWRAARLDPVEALRYE
jgi:lipoprotein-releasing system permease protein